MRIKRCLEFAEGVGSSWSTGNVIALLRTPRPPFDVELEVLALITVEWMNDCECWCGSISYIPQKLLSY